MKSLEARLAKLENKAGPEQLHILIQWYGSNPEIKMNMISGGNNKWFRKENETEEDFRHRAFEEAQKIRGNVNPLILWADRHDN